LNAVLTGNENAEIRVIQQAHFRVPAPPSGGGVEAHSFETSDSTPFLEVQSLFGPDGSELDTPTTATVVPGKTLWRLGLLLGYEPCRCTA
jgi:hypothetical protein